MRITRTRALLGITGAMLVSAAAALPAPASATCTKPIDDDTIRCVEAPICAVGYKLGFQCVD
jgi:hypothetical protein